MSQRACQYCFKKKVKRKYALQFCGEKATMPYFCFPSNSEDPSKILSLKVNQVLMQQYLETNNKNIIKSHMAK